MLINKLKRYFFSKKWRKRNSHNFTTADKMFNLELVSVGINSYGHINVYSYNDDKYLYIGNYCSVGPNVSFVLNAEHSINSISTYPFKVRLLGKDAEAFGKGNITIDDDVWIGFGATIMSGVHIGQGAVVAANAVVTKDVPPYAIVGGVPAKIIKYRFSHEIIEKLLQINYSKLTREQIEEHINELYVPVNECTNFDWLPKKLTNNEFNK